MGAASPPDTQDMVAPDAPSHETGLVDGVPWGDHQAYYESLPWYAFPVANLFSDANVSVWGLLSVVLVVLKFFAVAAVTTPTVALAVLGVSLLTALGWFAVFVLLGDREDHNLLWKQVPPGKFAQTFWVGAVGCPIAVYAVRGVIGAAMTAIPLFVATPTDVMYGGGDGEGDYGDGYGDGDQRASTSNTIGALFGKDFNAIAVAFVVAYLAAGLAEETAKYFGVARYYPTWDLLEKEGGGTGGITGEAPVVGDSKKSTAAQTVQGGTRRRRGCASPAAGWFTPQADPRNVVYLAFVVGLGFSFTENIQYGANVYEAATEWGRAGNVTMQKNVTLNPFTDPFSDYDADVGSSLTAEVGTAHLRSSTKTETPSGWINELFEVVSAALLSDVDPEGRVVEADVAPALAAAWRETIDKLEQLDGFVEKDFVYESSVGKGHDVNAETSKQSSVGKGHDVNAKTSKESSSEVGKGEARDPIITAADIFGADEPRPLRSFTRLKEQPDWMGANITVNITVRRRPYSEQAKWAAATTVTALRGATPMHAVWAGLTATRYVTKLWVKRSGYNFLDSIAWSWFYHGTFDFAIMAAPVLVANGSPGAYVFTVLGIGFATMGWSWVHLAKATFRLEIDLTRAGLGFGNTRRSGTPRLGLCTGKTRRACFCVCLPCVGVLCPGMGEWDDGDGDGDEENLQTASGNAPGNASYGAV